MKKAKIILIIFIITFLTIFNCCKTDMNKKSKDDNKVKIAMVVKNIGNSFFDACRDGGLEAAQELGDIELIYTAPETRTAEGQLEIIESLIKERVDVIAISSNDVDALVPVCKRAMERGIIVISFDGGIEEEGRYLHIDPSSDELIGRSQAELIVELIDYSGEIAYLTASYRPNNTWFFWFREELNNPKYNKIELLEIIYGDDLYDKSYNATIGLFRNYPNLRGIVAPTTVGIAAAAQAIEDEGLTGKVELTGFGLPSEMKKYVKSGTCKKFTLWNPINLGYSAVYVAYMLYKNEFEVEEGVIIETGRMGSMEIESNGVVIMGKPFVFDETNIDKFAEIY